MKVAFFRKTRQIWPFIVPKKCNAGMLVFFWGEWPFCPRMRLCQRKNDLSVAGSKGAMESDMVVGQLVGVRHGLVKKRSHLSSQASAGCTRR